MSTDKWSTLVRLLAAASLLLLTLVSVPKAATYVLRANGTGDFPDLSTAIASVSDGDVIELSDGLYSGPANQGISLGGRNVTIQSRDGTSTDCVVNLDYTTYAFLIANGETSDCKIKNIRFIHGVGGATNGGVITCSGTCSPEISGCDFEGNSADNGGAIYVTDSATPSIANCIFTANAAADNGGAIYIDGTDPLVSSCTFTDNAATFGGGLYCVASSSAITECTFTSNDASAGGGGARLSSFTGTFSGNSLLSNEAPYGGGLYVLSVGVVLSTCEFVGNSATLDGGGLFSSSGDVTCVNCSFEANDAAQHGPAAKFTGSDGTLVDCTVSNNTGSGTISVGGGAVDIAQCTLIGNSGSQGTFYVAGAGSAPCTIESSTFYGNSASVVCGVIYLSSGASVAISNTIIADSPAGPAVCCADGASTATLSCTALWGNADGNWVDDIADQLGVDGNIETDPLFCDAPNDDFTLDESSPCAYDNAAGSCGQIGVESVGCGYATYACCTGETCQLTTSAGCTLLGGIWEEGVDGCLPNPCVATAACCLEGVCVINELIECDLIGGDWDMTKTSCDPNPCPATAVCCHGGTCHVLTEASCAILDGSWLAGSTSCSPNPCPEEAACCDGATCTILSMPDCDALGGSWHPGCGCGPHHDCALLRACCVGTACELTWRDECDVMAGTFLIIAEACDPNPCASASEETSWGRIKMLFR